MSISKEKFKEMLREKGLKVTNQRILVLEVLADHRDKHLTAEDILMMDVHVMRSENSSMEKKDIIIIT